MFLGQPKLLQHRNPAAAQPRSSSTRLSFVTRASYNAGATNPFRDELIATAKYISQRGKGILASDESNATTGKRLATVGEVPINLVACSAQDNAPLSLPVFCRMHGR